MVNKFNTKLCFIKQTEIIRLLLVVQFHTHTHTNNY